MIQQQIVPPVTRRITVMQSQAFASNDPSTVYTTILGSCVATCLYDSFAGVGGMNHFLLAEPHTTAEYGSADEHYGIYLMEVLINEMLAVGALKSRMTAHLYGGANMHAGMTRIGSSNAAFARTFLERERIGLAHAKLGGVQARRIEFLPTLGRARCRLVAPTDLATPKPVSRPQDVGNVELF